MKKTTIVVILLICIISIQCKDQEGKNRVAESKEVILKNLSPDTLSSKPVVIQRSQLKIEDSSRFPVLSFQGKRIPIQLSDNDGDNNWDEIFLVTDFAPEETKNLQLEWVDEEPEYEVKTSARFGKRDSKDEKVMPATETSLTKDEMPEKQGFQKYQTDGPTWENDKVGFRQYLDGRFSKDIFGKKISDISPEDVGINEEGAVEDNYHVMEDWGRDILAVGNSVGVGGFGLFVNDTVRRLGALVTDTVSNVEKTDFKIQEEGPVKSVLKYNYEDWSAGGNSYDVEELTTIWPGIYGFKNSVSVSGLKGEEKLAVGMVSINNQNPVKEVEINDDWVALLTHDHQTYEREWILGLALILPKGNYTGYTEAPKEGKLTDSYLAKLNIENGKPVEYYVIAGWELSQEERFADSEFFEEYVLKTVNQISSEIEVEVN
ncbi:DUF4861 domain-containing protein [Christiangramia crocea]|uniref:DUF4861 domain-containing protein n=1 Tax=Christiangramia crocea TaxID=2904124 RepID=A0A9X1UTL8_9FLAO|nr:DUF4861 domain-containing protein [Gramella crocea]MCG9970013.1 DUF4861 domain-containing protein [Gramella crocea]